MSDTEESERHRNHTYDMYTDHLETIKEEIEQLRKMKVLLRTPATVTTGGLVLTILDKIQCCEISDEHVEEYKRLIAERNEAWYEISKDNEPQ